MFRIREVYVNRTENYRIDDTEFYEPFTQDVGELFKALQNEFGKCVSKMYIDREDGTSVQVGWVFQKKVRYEDCDEYYTQETWVEVDDSSIFE